MPRKKKALIKKAKKREIDLGEEWKKLREKIKIDLKETKKQKEEKEEEQKKETSELEEEIEESEIFENQFKEFIPVMENIPIRAPVLERREIPQETLEENIASTPLNTQEQARNIDTTHYFDDTTRDYSSLIQPREDERKYEPEPVILRPVRETREFTEFKRQEFLNPFAEERDWEDKIIDMSEMRTVEENRRRLPFETEKKKYKEYKPESLES